MKVHQFNACCYLDLKGGGAAGLEVKSHSPGPHFLHRPLQHRVGLRRVGRDPEAGPLDELPRDSLG